MKNNNVLEFPKSQSQKKISENRRNEKKAIGALSVLSVLVVSLFVNQWLTSKDELSFATGHARNVASYDTSLILKDMKWEQELARQLANEKDSKVQFSESPDLRDELLFGYLEGKYGMKLAQGQIQSLQFIDAQAGDKALKILDPAGFLKKFADATGIPYVEVSAGLSAEDQKQYSLIDSKKKIIGQAHFNLDSEGRVQSIDFKL